MVVTALWKMDKKKKVYFGAPGGRGFEIVSHFSPCRVFENRGNLFRITEFRKWTKKSAPKIREFRKLTTICTVKTIFLFLVIIHNECVALNEYNCKNPEH